MLQNRFDTLGALSILLDTNPQHLNAPTTMESIDVVDGHSHLYMLWRFTGIGRYLDYTLIICEETGDIEWRSQILCDIEGQYSNLPEKNWCRDEWLSMFVQVLRSEHWSLQYSYLCPKYPAMTKWLLDLVPLVSASRPCKIKLQCEEYEGAC